MSGLNIEQFILIYNDVIKYPTIEIVATALDRSVKSVKQNATRLRNQGYDLIERTEALNYSFDNAKKKLQRQANEISALKAQLKRTYKDVYSADAMRAFIHDLSEHEVQRKPDWLKPKKSEVGSGNRGIPTLFLSDIHFDEHVYPGQVEGMNEYNHDIAVSRIRHTFLTTVDLLKNKLTNPKYDGIVCALGGDMLSGNIHEELAETNEQPILKSAMDLTDLLVEGISMLADEFGKVFVPCVTGNHGRLSPKKKHKNKVYDNYEWVIYQNIAKYFSNDERVVVNVSNSSDIHYDIYNVSFLLTHGDQFRGGSGISGIFTPLMLGRSRKQQRAQAVRKNFDIMMLGHFHQYIHTEQLIVNGSIKGYDEFAYDYNFSFEKPQQALFVVHPTHGVTFRMPIQCDSYIGKRKTNHKLTVW